MQIFGSSIMKEKTYYYVCLLGALNIFFQDMQIAEKQLNFLNITSIHIPLLSQEFCV